MKYGTIDNFEASDNLLACKSGFYGQLSNNDIKILGKEYNQKSTEIRSVCLPTPKINEDSKPNHKCNNVLDTCKYSLQNYAKSTSTVNQEVIHSFELPCKCGFNSEGSSFCPIIFEDNFTSLL